MDRFELLLAKRLGVSREDAQDIAQEARLIALLRLGQRPTADDDGYLCEVAKNLAKNHHRAAVRTAAAMAEARTAGADSAPTTIEATDDPASLKLFAECDVHAWFQQECSLCGVEPKDAELFWQVATGKATTRQLAKGTGRSENAIRLRVKRSRAWLRWRLAGSRFCLI